MIENSILKYLQFPLPDKSTIWKTLLSVSVIDLHLKITFHRGKTDKVCSFLSVVSVIKFRITFCKWVRGVAVEL